MPVLALAQPLPKPGMTLLQIEARSRLNGAHTACCMFVYPRSRSEEPRYCGRPGAIRCTEHGGKR